MRLFSRRGATPAPPPAIQTTVNAASANASSAAKPRDEHQFTEADIVTILRAGQQGVLPEELCASEGITLKTYETWKAKYDGLSVSQVKVRRRRERTSRRNTIVIAGLVIVATLGWYAFMMRPGVSAAPPAPGRPAPQTPAARAASSPSAASAPAAAAAPAPAAIAPGTAKPPVPAAGTPTPAPPAATAAAANVPASPAAPAATTPTPVPAPTPAAAAAKTAPPSAPAPAAAAPATAPAAATKIRELDGKEPSGFSVQVAAVPTAELARTMVADLTRVGYPAYITRTTVGDTLLYRVRVGPFESRDATKVIAQRLENAGHRGAWIVAK